jgi:membrane protein YqaA with SNARE-associated domain
LIYITLFTLSLLSATLIPGGSEALLLYDISQGYNLLALLITATLGNTLGSIINYLIGKKGFEYLVDKKYVSSSHLLKAHNIFDKYGGFALLLSWMPIIGDPITFIAGVTKYSFKFFVTIVFIAKALRYIIISLLI